MTYVDAARAARKIPFGALQEGKVADALRCKVTRQMIRNTMPPAARALNRQLLRMERGVR